MQFVFSTFGSSGDVFPMVALALELQKRGSEVVFAVNPHFNDLVVRHGLRFEALGTLKQFADSVNSPDLWNPQKSFRHIFRTLLQPALKQQYELLDRYHRPGETIAITNCFGFGALVAQDKLRIPVLTVHCQPALIWSRINPPKIGGLLGPPWLQTFMYQVGERFFIDPVACPFINQWRRELDLAPVSKITDWWHSRYGVVCMFPEWYCASRADWPQRLIQTDFPLWDDPLETELPGVVEEFLDRGEPPLVFTPGSTNVYGAKFFQAAIEACQRLKRRGILLTHFPQQIPGMLPDGVTYFPFVPFSSLLPKAAAIVHHGGIGTVSQAMAAGVPQVIMPLAHDQFDNVDRTIKLGVGDRLVPRHFKGDELAKRLDRLLSSNTVARSCRETAQRLEAREGLARTAAAIEQWRSASANGC